MLGIRTPDGKFHTQRLLYTDSGHYLLPIDNFGKTDDESNNRIIMHEQKQLHRSEKTPPAKHVDHLHHRAKKGHLSFPVGIYTNDDDHDDDDETAHQPSSSSAPSPLFR